MMDMEQILQNIRHPIEGCAYLVYVGIFFRWKFPIRWNKLIENQLKDHSKII